MKVVIDDCVALNPHIIRVALYTHTDDDYKHYELAIPISDFTNTESDGSINIDGNTFQQVVSAKIIAAINTAMIAKIINDQAMEWELVSGEQQTQTEDTTNKDGLTLAYGNNIK